MPRQRHTRQRQVVLDVLQHAGRPLSFDECFARARALLPSFGLRTLYRNLDELIAEQRVMAIQYPGQPLRYEWATGLHRPHFICSRCQQVLILDADSPDIPFTPPPHLTITGSEVLFFGSCSLPHCPHLTAPAPRLPPSPS